jgi:hypothetical protein
VIIIKKYIVSSGTFEKNRLQSLRPARDLQLGPGQLQPAPQKKKKNDNSIVPFGTE